MFCKLIGKIAVTGKIVDGPGLGFFSLLSFWIQFMIVFAGIPSVEENICLQTWLEEPSKSLRLYE